MNQLTEVLNQKYTPEAALICYKNGHDTYLEAHRIQDGKMMEGAPVSEKFIAEITSMLKTKKQKPLPYSDELMPENIIYLDQRTENIKMIWWLRPQKRMIHFAKQLNIKSGSAFIPALIFSVSNDQLNVYAYKGKGKPKKSTLICRAPFFNTASSGSVCLGTAETPYPKDLTYSNLMKYWEKLFFGSEFTHLTGSDNVTVTNTAFLWKALILNGEPFPQFELLETKLTLIDLID